MSPGPIKGVTSKQLARFERVGHRITGDRRQGSSRGAGYEKVHVAIDDATRLAYVEVLADEQRATTVGFLARAVGWFSEQGITCRRILSDNGSAYRSGDWRKACRALDLKPIRTKPYTPQTNGKAERFIKTILAEWAYVIAYQTSEERNRWLRRYLAIYNGNRCHMALGGLTPQQSLQRLLIAE
ncbi:integrase core domain-containing protein [Cyanobium sp. NIES-981]|uniref:integrase core domain-containing protein n=1 Tax=Cyanobium sp. NIES-981 TaxID=1851505 RepID=UPI0035100EAF